MTQKSLTWISENKGERKKIEEKKTPKDRKNKKEIFLQDMIVLFVLCVTITMV